VKQSLLFFTTARW